MRFDYMYGGMYVHGRPIGAVLLQASGATQSRPSEQHDRDETMARKKISTTIYITPEQDERLKLLHERTKVPVAVYIREGIDLVLEQHEAELPGQLQLAVGAEANKK